MRDELLNETLFFGLDHARAVIADWIEDYNTTRPHSSLGYQTPAAYAAALQPARGHGASLCDGSAPWPLAITAPQGVCNQQTLADVG
jgi:putative transposase